MSYEFALVHVGQDKDSSEIHSDYIQFLKSGEVNPHVLRSPQLVLNSILRPLQHGRNSKKWMPFAKPTTVLFRSL